MLLYWELPPKIRREITQTAWVSAKVHLKNNEPGYSLNLLITLALLLTASGWDPYLRGSDESDQGDGASEDEFWRN